MRKQCQKMVTYDWIKTILLDAIHDIICETIIPYGIPSNPLKIGTTYMIYSEKQKCFIWITLTNLKPNENKITLQTQNIENDKKRKRSYIWIG